MQEQYDILKYENLVLKGALESVNANPSEVLSNAAELKTLKKNNKVLLQQQLQQQQALQDKGSTTSTSSSEAQLSSVLSPTREPTISFNSFNVNDVALFMPVFVNNKDTRTYLAFNTNCHHRYLSDQSILPLVESNADKRWPDFVLGRIVLVETHAVGRSRSRSSNKSVGGGSDSKENNIVKDGSEEKSDEEEDANPYGLPAGTNYYILHVEVLT